jgi:hypothetical protein
MRDTTMDWTRLTLTCVTATALARCTPKAENREGLGAGGAAQDSLTYPDTMSYSGWDSVNADTGRSGTAPKY